MPVTSDEQEAYFRVACIISQQQGLSLAEYLQSALVKNTALTGKPSIQSTSYGGQSASYFAPGEGGGMTASDQVQMINWALRILPCIEITLEVELGRPPTPAEICSAVISNVPPGVAEVRLDYTLLRSGCGCG